MHEYMSIMTDTSKFGSRPLVAQQLPAQGYNRAECVIRRAQPIGPPALHARKLTTRFIPTAGRVD